MLVQINRLNCIKVHTMRLLRILCFLFLLPTTCFATHIAGGQITISWLAANKYQATVTIYRDCDAGIPSLPSNVDLGVYQSGTNTLISSFIVPLVSTTPNLTFGDSCYTPPSSLCIDEGIYISDTIYLADFVDGYYLSTGIFARNEFITNLDNAGSQGITFYAWVYDPAMGQNSTPQFQSYPPNAYFCLGYDNFVNFIGSDPDGDSLSFELTEPLYANSSGNYPGPYTPVTWETGGYDIDNILGPSSLMTIDSVSGVVHAYPLMSGLFVFAVRVYEWRGGVNIAISQNDVQFYVYNCVPCNVGVSESLPFGVQWYPNPASSELYISFAESQTLDVCLYDLQGRKVSSDSFEAQNAVMDVSNLPCGNYIIEFTNSTGTTREPLVIK